MSKLQELAATVEERLHAVFDKDGYTIPVWFLEGMESGEEGFVIATPFQDKEAKEAVASNMKDFIKEKNIVRFLTVLEMWYLSGDRNTIVDTSIPPSKHPDRKEGVLIYGEDRDTHEMIAKLLRIDRSEGKPRLVPDKEVKDCEAYGTFTNMFQHPKPNLH